MRQLGDLQAASFLLPKTLALSVEVLFLLGVGIGLRVLVLQRLVLVAEEQFARWQTQWLRAVAVSDCPRQGSGGDSDTLLSDGCRRAWC